MQPVVITRRPGPVNDLPRWRPFVNPELIVRSDRRPDREIAMIIDPWTQRWAVVEGKVLPVFRWVDGSRTVDEIADAAAASGDTLLGDPEVLRGLLEHLRDAGMVYASRSHHRASGWPVYSEVEIQGLHLEITNACNLRCAHCYVSSGVKLPNELSTEELKRVIDQLPPFSDRLLAISGGEPAVRRDCMELVEYAVLERGLRVDLYSNAYKFPRKFAERLVAINEAGPGSVSLQVSIEGARPTTNDAVRGEGVFAQIEKSMAMFRELGLHRKVTLFACVTSANCGEVDNMIALAERWDVGRLVFSQWQRQGNASDTPWASIAPSTEQWCEAGQKVLAHANPRLTVLGNFFGDLNNDSRGRFSLDSPLFPKHLYAYNAVPRVSPDGMIFADQFWTTEDWSLGNVRDMTLDEAFRTQRFAEQLAAFRARPEAIPECRSCDWVALCGSGSPGHTHAEYGDVNHRDLFCEARQYWFEQYARRQLAAVETDPSGARG